MSRSRKKNPFVGMTTASSEKWDKRKANRSLRRHVKDALASGLPIPDLREISSVWDFAKDGKQWVGGDLRK